MRLAHRTRRRTQVVKQSSNESPRGEVVTEDGKLVAVVTTSVPLNQTEKQLVEQLVAKPGGSRVEYRYRIDSQLLGGVRVLVGDWVIDASLQTQLAQIAAQLKE